MGNVSNVFRTVPNIKYHGLDIDARAIDIARHRFIQYPNFKFICEDLEIYAEKRKKEYDLEPIRKIIESGDET